nr:Protein HAPLESS 2-A like [Ipomoea batatas]
MAGGGDHGGDFREKVWTMAGGPNCRPRYWKRNTAIAMAGIVLICIPIAMKSAELESVSAPNKVTNSNYFDTGLLNCGVNLNVRQTVQRPHNPVRPIPSQLWCKNFGTKEY